MITPEIQSTINNVPRKYASKALVAAVVCGGCLIFAGHASLGKGLIAGTIFSALNFWLMAKALPARMGHGRGKSILVSMTSIYGRLALMALPLIFAAKYPQVAVSTVAIGLFAIPLVILGEHLWQQWRQSREVNC